MRGRDLEMAEEDDGRVAHVQRLATAAMRSGCEIIALMTYLLCR